MEKYKQYMLNQLDKLIDYLFKIKCNTEHKLNNEEGLNYISLTPTDQCIDSVYQKALKWALKNQSIKNIALTGTYGSGKSSIIKTFEKYNTAYKILNISLATFNDNIPETNESKNNQLIELSILQQLFYQVENSKLPDSRFKRIHGRSSVQLFLFSIGILIWLISCFIFFDFAFFTDTPFWNSFHWVKSHEKITAIISFTIASIGVIVIISRFTRVLNNAKIHKLNLKNGEFEIANDGDTSILNKHLDEIIYFFETTKYDIVVIEDLDRFEDKMIFTKLREINELINKSEQIDRRVVFLYAIKDDLFKDRSRAKFFDFIVPVIPVINPSNAGDILRQRLNEANLMDRISEEFISDISLYIDDMRLLYNIFNEFAIYKSNLNSKLDPEMLLAIIVYKNMHPSDFAKLHYGTGDIFDAFKLKSSYIHDKTIQTESEINSVQEEIRELEQIKLMDETELYSIIAYIIIKRIPQATTLMLSNRKTYNIESIGNNEFMNEFKKVSITHWKNNYTNWYSDNISFASIEEALPYKEKFDRRIALINDKANNKIEDLRNKLTKLIDKKNQIRHFSLYQCLKDNPQLLNSQFDNLQKFLLRNGYIDENYYDYISYFYEGEITRTDKDFILSVKNQEALSNNLSLTNIANVIKKLRIKDFEQIEILNINLLDFIIENRTDYNSHFETIFNQLANSKAESTSFIDNYIAEGKNIEEFIKTLSFYWVSFWNYIDNESNYPSKKINEYFKLIITHAENIDISSMDTNQEFSSYFTQNIDLIFIHLSLNEQYLQKIQELIIDLDIVFTHISKDVISFCPSLFDYIYKSSVYEINTTMIKTIIDVKGNQDSHIDFETRNYTAIKNSSCDSLIKYIENSIDYYISNVFLSIKSNTQESEESIIYLLNHIKIQKQFKTQMITNWSLKLSEISRIENIELWSAIIENSKMQSIWNNIFDCFESEIDLKDSLNIYLNKEENYIALSGHKLNSIKDKEEELIEKLSSFIIFNQKLSYESFAQLINSVPYNYKSITANKLSEQKVSLMIEKRRMTVTTENYSLLKQYYPAQRIKLLEKDPFKFIEILENFVLDKNDILEILRSSMFNDSQKMKIIDFTDVEYFEKNKSLSNIVCKLLVANKYEELDYGKLKKIVQFADSLADNLSLFTKELRRNSLKHESIDELLSLMSEPYRLIADKNKRPKLNSNEINREFSLALVDVEYISSAPIKDDMIRIYHYSE